MKDYFVEMKEEKLRMEAEGNKTIRKDSDSNGPLEKVLVFPRLLLSSPDK